MTNLEKTWFMNKKTFSSDELRSYPYNERKTYLIDFVETDRDTISEPIKVYATDDACLIVYLSKVYHPESILSISEQIADYREVNF